MEELWQSGKVSHTTMEGKTVWKMHVHPAIRPSLVRRVNALLHLNKGNVNDMMKDDVAWSGKARTWPYMEKNLR